MAPPLQALAWLRTFQRISLLLGRGVVESWSLNAKHFRTTPELCTVAETQEKQVVEHPLVVLQPPVFRHLASKWMVKCHAVIYLCTSWHILAHLPSPLHWTLHCIVYFQSVLNASVIHPTQSYAHLHVVTCRSTLKHLFVGAVQKFFISCYTSADSS